MLICTFYPRLIAFIQTKTVLAALYSLNCFYAFLIILIAHTFVIISKDGEKIKQNMLKIQQTNFGYSSTLRTKKKIEDKGAGFILRR